MDTTDKHKEEKRLRKGQVKPFFFWLIILSVAAILTGSILYNQIYWKEPRGLAPAVDAIDIGVHNAKHGRSFKRGPNALFSNHNINEVKSWLGGKLLNEKSKINEMKGTPESSLPNKYSIPEVSPVQSQGLKQNGYLHALISTLKDHKITIGQDCNFNFSTVEEVFNQIEKNPKLCSISNQGKSITKIEKWKIINENQMKYEIFQGRPLLGVLHFTSNFLTYKSGFYEALQPSKFELELEHVVKVIGWSENKGKACWQIQNSWGVDWGDNGIAFVCTMLSPVIGFKIH